MPIRLLSGLSDIAGQHDALICDVWGVVHDGHHANLAACEALRRFRENHGPVVLLTNAPRVPAAVAEQCAGFGVPAECYDAIVSSGGAARAELVRRSSVRHLPLYYIGTSRDVSIYQGLDVSLASLEEAKAILCAGLRDDDREAPADYGPELKALAARGLPMLCANPDLVVHRGSRLYWCAGAIARDYAALGGEVIYYGKPHGPVYDMARAEIAGLRKGVPATRPLAIGDGMPTDIMGANAQGLTALFIADGIHGEEIEPYTEAHLDDLLGRSGVSAAAALRALTW
ncbi:MAG: TIGR01459 family HAD-type hydrolase [Alphaproteobacteria bacterium]|nr:TIGR01459 family HAD-type hydrolase [Alphaproteobacteria bacterium]